ncbi:glycosyltransferase family 9 protein [Nocardia donostiensis]|uniref:Glycosyl transferase n=1 Tax=Nocardia donostiensis TaxID=1538463 RepID=A0A1V2TKV1_9NOCA|nr:glycosyltransferase family 9 protein [Nocardia donostiensis]ONM50122.1 glycosyl transferase [Nocardia donostiensis]OQS15784.1 glycosyl transferase [Nocardia donostiensis]OQS23589.1 glycosyl transferase [Nocardia donostiensis]
MSVVLVLQARGLGDLLTAVPALRALRRARPNDRLVLAAPHRLRSLVGHITSVDAMVPTADLGSLRWDGPAPDLAVNLHGPGAEPIVELNKTGARRVLTHSNKAFPELEGPQWHDDMHPVDRWCHLLESAGIAADRRNLGLVPPVATTSHRDCVVVHIGAGAGARRWPAERFAAVIRHLLVLGREVVVTGDEFEREIALGIAARAGLSMHRVLAGEQNLIELAATVAEASLMVSGDTGAAHLATAFGTRTVQVFGPRPPHQAGPPPHLLARHEVLWAGEPGDPNADTPGPGLLQIQVSDVIAAVDQQLSRRNGANGDRRAAFRHVG